MSIGGLEAVALDGKDLWFAALIDLQGLVPLFVGYALGSIPFGLILTRLGGAGDIRQVGSGNIGATNVLRTGRKGLAAATLLFDAAKGFAPVLLFRLHAGLEPALFAAAGAFLGHLFPVWLNFRGGKGVATYIGVVTALYWPAGVFFCAAWLCRRAAQPLFVGVGAERGGAYAGFPADPGLHHTCRLCGRAVRAPDRTPSPEHPELDRRERKQDIFSGQKQVVFLPHAACGAVC